jgi:hypothetical protein
MHNALNSSGTIRSGESIENDAILQAYLPLDEAEKPLKFAKPSCMQQGKILIFGMNEEGVNTLSRALEQRSDYAQQKRSA